MSMILKNLERRATPFALIIGCAFLALFIGSCSIQQLAIDIVADALSGGGGTGSASAFTGDNDPDLVGDALPFALKLYEILLSQSPENEALHLTTGTAFVMYANAYVQGPADMMPDEEFEQRRFMRERAKKLYIRGRDYILQGLDLKYPGFKEAVLAGEGAPFLEAMGPEDVNALYWAGAGWLAAVSINLFDVEIGITRESSVSLLTRALEIDETYSEGAIHEVLISYYGALPAMMGGSEQKARYHFQRVVEISGDTKPGPYIALATSVSKKNLDSAEFRHLLEKALSFEAVDPDTQLITIISQRKAQWLLDHIGDYFFDVE